VLAFDRCQLYTFVDTAYLAGRSPALVATQLCDGGADVIQVRAKQESLDEVRRLVEEVKAITDRHAVILVVNDYPEIAVEFGVPAVHLGQEDFFGRGHVTASAVTGTPPRFELGLSTHAPAQAERAAAAGPAYVAIGPIFATPTKPGRPPVTLDYVRWAAKHLALPWFAIGGIHLNNLEDVLAAGARRICVVSAILSAPDVARACQAFRKCLGSAR
jgi:thiamine-phosphate pyrophosphorylase